LLDSHIVIGKILKPFGKEGWLNVLSLTDFPQRFSLIREVYLYDEITNKYLENETKSVYTISESRINGNSVQIKFILTDNKFDASKFVNMLICIDEKDRMSLPYGQFYLYEIIGFCVFFNGELLGTVEKVENYGSDDLLKIIKKNENKYFYVPINNYFIRDINLNRKEIQINVIEGLIDNL